MTAAKRGNSPPRRTGAVAVPEEVRAAVGDLVEAYAYQVAVSILVGQDNYRLADPVGRLTTGAAEEVGSCQWRVKKALAGGGDWASDQVVARSATGSQRARDDVAAARREREAAGR